MMSSETVNCLIINQTASKLLLPKVALVEVINGQDLDIVVDLQGALLGKLQWKGWTVPLLSFEAARDGSIPKFNNDTQSTLWHAQTDDEVYPFIGLTAQGDMEPVAIKEEDLYPVDIAADNEFVHSVVRIGEGEELYIPDLAALAAYAKRFF